MKLLVRVLLPIYAAVVTVGAFFGNRSCRRIRAERAAGRCSRGRRG